ncbi:FxDxF family PEP-CTERM protein [Herbaspirillum lusitanum]|uniref:FxDxF family PEP-CTERM protein n=1 Tax=Herbaspirillum lusitanum TaxID=213312 RepID=A0ABW9A3D0_9BURK
MQKILASILLTLFLALIGPIAHAANINGTSALVFNNDTSSFGASFGSGTKNKTFLENYTFSYSSPFDVSSAVISIALSNVSSVNISSFTLSGNGSTYTGSKTVVGNTVYYTLNASSLSSGSYVLSVAGTVTGTRGGSFGGNINVSPVPEVSSAAMMLGGLMLVGFVALRRRTSVNTGTAANRPSLGHAQMA